YAGNDPVGRSYRQGRAARTELIAGLPPPAPTGDGAVAPDGFATQAARLAALIAGNRNIRLVFVGLGGWDTHVRQGAVQGQLADRLRPLGEGLAGLAHGLGRDWQDT